jgi:hypothetical protein
MNNEQHNAPTLAHSDIESSSNEPVLAPSDSKILQYSWSTDEETYHDQCNSIEEAIAEALGSGGDFELGTAISIGEIIPVEAIQLIDADSVIDNMSCQAFDLAGEPSEDYLGHVTKEQKAELEALIAAWADRVEKPAFWQIGKTHVHIVTAADLAQTCEAGQPECGPVEHYDSEGVPLCAGCWEALLADSQAADATEVKS